MPDKLPLVLEILNLALFLTSLAVWTLVIQRSRQGSDLVSYEPRRPVPWQGVDLALVFLAFLLLEGLLLHAAAKTGAAQAQSESNSAQAVSHPAAASEASHDKDQSATRPMGTSELLALITSELLTGALAIFWVIYRVRATPRDLGLDCARFGFDIRLGALTFLAAYLPVMGLQLVLQIFIPYDHSLVNSVKARPDALTLGLTGISAILVAPLFEELFFRVIMQGCFEAVEAKRRWLLTVRLSPSGSLTPTDRNAAAGVRPIATETELSAQSGPAAWPIVLTSLLFAAVHAGQGAAPVPLFLFSLFLGYVYQRTHRIWPSLVAHVLLNTHGMATLWIELVSNVK